MRRPAPIDLALGAAVAGVMVAENLIWSEEGLGLSVGRCAAVTALFAAAVVLVRGRPQPAAWVAAAGLATLVAVPAGSNSFLVSCVATMAATAWWSGRADGLRLITPTVFTAAAVAAALAVIVDGQADAAFYPLLLLGIFAVVPWLLGRFRAQQRALIRAQAAEVDRLERERHIIAEQTRLRERARLAEQMHDSLGHELSLLALRAGGLELARDLPESVRRPVGELRAGIGAATARLAEIVGVLHEESEPAPLEPTGGSLEPLLERARAAGLAVELTETGAPPPDLVAATVYRIVQEGLTNAAKHAAGATVRVTVDTDDGQTTVTVRTDGVRPALPRATSSGRGLIGLTERVRLSGGELSAGPERGGFQLRARLPHHGGRSR